jgi:transposase InsO family protein
VSQVWCWEITYLPATVIGRWFHLYLILDLYSRKIVGWEVHANDNSDHAVHLVRRTALAEGIAALAVKPVLHEDNGATLKATTVLAMLDWLGVKPSYSRPRVSVDNADAESLFRTAKYRPEFPVKGFATLETARSLTGHKWGNLNWPSGLKYLNNIVEQDHRAVKRVTKPMLNFKSFRAAKNVLVGIELKHMIRKGQLMQQGFGELSSADHFCALAGQIRPV